MKVTVTLEEGENDLIPVVVQARDTQSAIFDFDEFLRRRLREVEHSPTASTREEQLVQEIREKFFAEFKHVLD